IIITENKYLKARTCSGTRFILDLITAGVAIPVRSRPSVLLEVYLMSLVGGRVCGGGGSFPPLSYLSFFCRSSFLLSPFHAVFFFYLLSASCGVLVLCRRCCVGGV